MLYKNLLFTSVYLIFVFLSLLLHSFINFLYTCLFHLNTLFIFSIVRLFICSNNLLFSCLLIVRLLICSFNRLFAYSFV